eukprot:scaffold146748_cov21-Prasinocladus_malaysianus.AAC.1
MMQQRLLSYNKHRCHHEHAPRRSETPPALELEARKDNEYVWFDVIHVETSRDAADRGNKWAVDVICTVNGNEGACRYFAGSMTIMATANVFLPTCTAVV